MQGYAGCVPGYFLTIVQGNDASGLARCRDLARMDVADPTTHSYAFRWYQGMHGGPNAFARRGQFFAKIASILFSPFTADWWR